MRRGSRAVRRLAHLIIIGNACGEIDDFSESSENKDLSST